MSTRTEQREQLRTEIRQLSQLRDAATDAPTRAQLNRRLAEKTVTLSLFEQTNAVAIDFEERQQAAAAKAPAPRAAPQSTPHLDRYRQLLASDQTAAAIYRHANAVWIAAEETSTEPPPEAA